MRENVIRARYEANDIEAEYLCEVARRLAPLFPQGVTDVSVGMALFYLLQTFSVTFDDGFVINPLSDLKKTIGNQEAAVVLAALDAFERSPEWWDEQRFAGPASEADKQAYADLRARIGAIPEVSRID